MTTVARPTTRKDSHWYYSDGRPCYELPKKDGSGMKTPTLADARKLLLLPSVTTILKILNKPELQNWIVEQAVLAVITTPRKEGEGDDAYIQRVLHVEEVQNQERDLARDKGIAIHDACEDYFQGRDVPAEMRPWVMPAVEAVSRYGELVATESILVGSGYAGRTDLILMGQECWWLFDYKGTKRLPPKGAWREHVLQLAAYAAAYSAQLAALKGDNVGRVIKTANVYISTAEEGKFQIWEHDPNWKLAHEAFMHLVSYWQFENTYAP